MIDATIAYDVGRYYLQLQGMVVACRQVRQVLAGKPVPYGFGRLADPNCPPTVTADDVRELRHLFERLLAGLRRAHAIRSAIAPILGPIADVVNGGRTVGPPWCRDGSFAAVAARMVEQEVRAIPLDPDLSLAADNPDEDTPPEEQVRFMTTDGPEITHLVAVLAAPPGQDRQEFPLTLQSDPAESAAASVAGPPLFGAFTEEFDAILAGLAEEQLRVLEFLSSRAEPSAHAARPPEPTATGHPHGTAAGNETSDTRRGGGAARPRRRKPALENRTDDQSKKKCAVYKAICDARRPGEGPADRATRLAANKDLAELARDVGIAKITAKEVKRADQFARNRAERQEARAADPQK